MSLTEKAWKQIDAGWHPFAQHHKGDSEALHRVRQSIRRLQQMRLPVAAIDEIHTLIGAVQSYEQEQECENCGERCDGIRTCARCGMTGNGIDSISDLCDQCMEEDDADEEGL